MFNNVESYNHEINDFVHNALRHLIYLQRLRLRLRLKVIFCSQRLTTSYLFAAHRYQGRTHDTTDVHNALRHLIYLQFLSHVPLPSPASFTTPYDILFICSLLPKTQLKTELRSSQRLTTSYLFAGQALKHLQLLTSETIKH